MCCCSEVASEFPFQSLIKVLWNKMALFVPPWMNPKLILPAHKKLIYSICRITEAFDLSMFFLKKNQFWFV